MKPCCAPGCLRAPGRAERERAIPVHLPCRHLPIPEPPCAPPSPSPNGFENFATNDTKNRQRIWFSRRNRPSQRYVPAWNQFWNFCINPCLVVTYRSQRRIHSGFLKADATLGQACGVRFRCGSTGKGLFWWQMDYSARASPYRVARHRYSTATPPASL